MWPAACMPPWALLVVGQYHEPPVPKPLFCISKAVWSVFCVLLRSGCGGSQKQTTKCRWLQLWCDVLQKLLWPPQGSSWLTRWIYLLLQKPVWGYLSCSASPRSRGRDYIIYHCQLYRDPQVKDLHLLAVIISLYFDVRTTIISSKMYLYWPEETADLHTTIQFFCNLFLYSKWHFPLIALPQCLSEIITAVDCLPQEVISGNWQLCLSVNLLPTCRVHVVHSLTASLYLSTHIHSPSQWVFHRNSEKRCCLLSGSLYI